MGPLQGVKVIELAGIGPGPFCGMMLSDMGADVIRVDRITSSTRAPRDIMQRNRKSIAVNLKSEEGRDVVLRMAETADALFEGFRPGVTERLGLGPDDCFARNKKLVYGRMTGWGQEGPLALAAGHDINYIGLSGALHAIGEPGGKPVPPLNLIGDFGGGGMLLAFGLVCALLEARRSGEGQVVDAAMIDGSASLMAAFYSMAQHGFVNERGANLLDGGAHFYNTYETRDGKYICVGSIEPQFYELLLRHAEVTDAKFREQMNREEWPSMRDELARIFKTKTREEWCEVMEGTDICFAPVLSVWEAPQHPHNTARESFIELDGVTQPAPAPRFSRSRPDVRHGARIPGQDAAEVLRSFRYSEEEINELRSCGAVG
ncbi:MAG: CaiB/BaiF CoA-transferase family protein [Gammaproteobacteria bacterium]|nr:CaiB/BaiF CoA-transferase family protein [Gammaproteobacteria bacterium]